MMSILDTDMKSLKVRGLKKYSHAKCSQQSWDDYINVRQNRLEVKNVTRYIGKRFTSLNRYNVINMHTP